MDIRMKHFISPFLLGCSLVLFSGCGQKSPPGFPAVYPMTVTVTDGTMPLSDVRVTIRQADSSSGGAYVSSGVTNSSGIATIGTVQGSYAKKGIPEGEFLISLEELIEVDIGMTPEEFLALPMSERGKVQAAKEKKRAAVPRKVPDVLRTQVGNKDVSRLHYTATKGKNALSVNVAEYR